MPKTDIVSCRAVSCGAVQTVYVHNEVFNKNFFRDFRGVLRSTPSTHARVARLDLCDFGPIHAHLAQQRETRCQARADPEKRKARKAERERERQRHGVALVDGKPVLVANWQIEPPGLFRGRGQHPQAGRLKPRVMPESITLNLGRGVNPPQPGGGGDEAMAGREWGAVVHNQSVTWLARWRDHVTGLDKFVFMSPTAASSQARGRERFEAARQLKAHIEAIREAYMEDLNADDERQWQCATALWLIDHAGLRVGSEKAADSESEAPSVGCCSLRVEHVRCDEATSTVHFDFLGKDSLRYRNAIEVPPLVFARLQRLVGRDDKRSTDDVFDRLCAIHVTTRLKELMPGLTASRLRIFNNSSLLQHELSKPLPPGTLSVAEKVDDTQHNTQRYNARTHAPHRTRTARAHQRC